MAVVDVLNTSGEKVSQCELADNLFNVPAKSGVLQQVVTMQLARRRTGTASVKRRSDVKGSSRKLFRQKGTGRARRGAITSPLLRGGGATFGPEPRSFEGKVSKKVRRLALKMALSEKLKNQKLVVLDQFDLDEIKTKAFVAVMQNLDVQSVLIVTDQKNETLELSSRNVQNVKVLRSEGLNVYDLLKYEKLVLLEPALKDIEGRLLS